MRRLLSMFLTGIFLLICLTGCAETASGKDDATETVAETAETVAETADTITEADRPVTIEDIIAANTRESIFANYKSMTVSEHDFVQDRDTVDYYSEEINYRTGRDYFLYISSDRVVSDDPEGSAYGCIVDEDTFADVRESYMTISWLYYEGSLVTLNDNNTFTVTGEFEDYIISYDADSLLFLTKEILNKDGSNWITATYEYSPEDKDDEITAIVNEEIDRLSGGENVNLYISTDDGEKHFTVPKNFSAIIYSDDYYAYEDTEEGYYSAPLTEDTLLIKVAEE